LVGDKVWFTAPLTDKLLARARQLAATEVRESEEDSRFRAMMESDISDPRWTDIGGW
jgi:hypothetical protein